MRKKVIIFIIAFLVVCGLISWRVVEVNRGREEVPVTTYQMGEEVILGDNIRLGSYSNENLSDYTITVNSAEILTYQEYLDKYNYVEDPENPLFEPYVSNYPEMVYDVNITVRNISDVAGDGGVDLTFYTIYGTDFYMQTSSPLYTIANPHVAGGIERFALLPGAEKEISLPFYFQNFRGMRLDVEDIRSEELVLPLTYWPEQLQVVIKETE